VWPLTTAARLALTQSHAMTARVTVYSPTTGMYPDLPISGGSVDIDTTSQVRRKATLTVDPTFWPATPTDLLAPYGSEAAIEYGIVLGTGEIEWIPLGRFSLDETGRERPVSGSADVSVALVDRSARVAEDRLDAPAQTVAGATCVAEIRRLIQETLGTGVPVNDLTGSSQVAPQMEIDKDRWGDGVEKLADAIGAECYFDVLGQGVIRPQPTLADAPVWTITTGVYDSNLVSAKEKLTRDGVYNRVVASGSRTDGTPPVYAGVSDTDPNSPTFYGGPFGRKPRFYSSPLLTTVPQCTAAATALLERVRGLGVQIQITQLVNPALEGGDVILLVQNGAVTTHIVDQASIPLTPDGAQQLGTRSSDLPPAE
jgi:hypothetical protein